MQNTSHSHSRLTQSIYVYRVVVAQSIGSCASICINEACRRPALGRTPLQQWQVLAVAQRLQHKTRSLGDNAPLHDVTGCCCCRHCNQSTLHNWTSRLTANGRREFRVNVAGSRRPTYPGRYSSSSSRRRTATG